MGQTFNYSACCYGLFREHGCLQCQAAGKILAWDESRTAAAECGLKKTY